MLFKTRHHLLFLVFVLYLLPLLALTFYSSRHAPEMSWGVFSLAFLLLSLGTLILFLLIRYRENELLSHRLDVNALSEEQEKMEEEAKRALGEAEERFESIQRELAETYMLNDQFQAELQTKQQLLAQVNTEKELLQAHISQLLAELNQVKEATEEKLEQNQIFLNEHQQTITEQRHAIEIKQQYIQQLEDKVRDLTYEIKTLLNLAERTEIKSRREFTSNQESFFLKGPVESEREETNTRPPFPIQLSQEEYAMQQLKHCIDIAQKMTGASHYQNRSGRKSELAVEHYALDLRCLFESLRNETSSGIMIYSQKENKLIFGNNQIKPLLGWTAEKFLQNFFHIIEESREAWNGSLSQLAYKNECQADFMMRARNGTLVPVKCYFGVIPTGIFRSNILGLLYPGAPEKKQAKSVAS